jgi:mannose-6-phosphate isomerase-like protein (cupin superfamily)
LEYVSRVDFAEFKAKPTERITQALVSSGLDLKSCAINCIQTPAGGGSPAGFHTHAVDQIFYILEGVMGIEIAGVEQEVGPGSLIVFPAGVPHRNWNGGTQPTVHLAINTPTPDPNVPFAQPATR